MNSAAPNLLPAKVEVRKLTPIYDKSTGLEVTVPVIVKVPVRRHRRLHPKMIPFKKGYDPRRYTAQGPTGKKLMTRVREILKMKSVISSGINGREDWTRFDDVAEAFVRALEGSSFMHVKEFIDREEGKVPNRIAGADGGPVKLYAGLPLDGDDAP